MSAEIFGGRRNDVIEDFVIGPIRLEPLLCKKVETGVILSVQFAVVIRPLIRECLRPDQRVDKFVAFVRILVSQECTYLIRRRQKPGGIQVRSSQKFRIARQGRMRNLIAFNPSKDEFIDEILFRYRRIRLRAGRRQRRSYGFRQLAGVLCLILSLKQSAMRFFNTVIIQFLLGWLRRVLLRQRLYRKRQS